MYSRPKNVPAPEGPRAERFERLLKRLRWVAILGPVLLVGVLEVGARLFYPDLLTWPGHLVMAGIVVVCLFFFFGVLFEAIEQIQRSLARRNSELLALHRASLDIYGELSLDVILQKVVDQTRVLLKARYGAVSVMTDDGQIQQFVTSGVDDELRTIIGAPPAGTGLLGVSMREGESLRLADMTSHPRSAGFPEHHPPMKSLLAVPISCKGSFRGNLYLTDKDGGRDFTADDEATLSRFAQQVAIAIDNADLHRQLNSLAIAEERERIAREMHDGMAQILAYVNTKAQVVREHLRRDRPSQAAEHLEQLAEAARAVYDETREGILALRTIPERRESLAQTLRRFADRWSGQSNIAVDIDAEDDLDLDASIELQLLRIVQEALANARKHSGSRQARVRLTSDSGRVLASVADDGKGFDPEQLGPRAKPRFGLSIMRERAESVGGTISIKSQPGGGTRVSVEIPITRNSGMKRASLEKTERPTS
jgi:signal transduction histidine kinase